MTGTRTALALLAAIVLAGPGLGCLHVGEEFPVNQVASIEKGKTTRDEIRQRFGNPWSTGVEDGQRTWTYAQYALSIFGGASRRDLVVRFDERGVVSSYTFNSTHPEDVHR